MSDTTPDTLADAVAESAPGVSFRGDLIELSWRGESMLIPLASARHLSTCLHALIIVLSANVPGQTDAAAGELLEGIDDDVRRHAAEWVAELQRLAAAE